MDCNLCPSSADAEQAVKGSDNYSNVTALQLVQTMWIMGDTLHPLPPDGVEASALYPDVKYTTLESYLTQLAQTGNVLKLILCCQQAPMLTCSHLQACIRPQLTLSHPSLLGVCKAAIGCSPSVQAAEVSLALLGP